MAHCTGIMAHTKTEWWLTLNGQVAQTSQEYSLNIEDGVNILDKHYVKIQLVREDSILASYLSGILLVSQEKN